MQERESLRQQLQHLQTQTFTVVPDFAVEQVEVKLARLRVEQARDAISNFYADSPWTDYARRVLPLSEKTELGKLEGKYQEAKGKLTLAIAKLTKAKQQNRVRHNQSTQKAKLIAEIHTIENKLNTKGIVRSPYNGQIKSIKWLRQTDQELYLDLVITVSGQSVSL
ncbi:hypothetical protein AM10699_58070 (plasmid) [Acaryochloris marina MBIC10699]|nr:hypothetical protein AM10699_58070 [Acaryochloris marina MBIC10699]